MQSDLKYISKFQFVLAWRVKDIDMNLAEQEAPHPGGWPEGVTARAARVCTKSRRYRKSIQEGGMHRTRGIFQNKAVDKPEKIEDQIMKVSV